MKRRDDEMLGKRAEPHERRGGASFVEIAQTIGFSKKEMKELELLYHLKEGDLES